MANELKQFVHAWWRSMRRAAVCTDHLGTDLRRVEETMPGPLADLRAKRSGVGGFRIKVSNRFLEPREDLTYGPYRFLGQVAVHFVAQASVDAAIPEPADSYIDFAVVDLLEFDCQVRHLPILDKELKAVSHTT
jgi:hypothetical protein